MLNDYVFYFCHPDLLYIHYSFDNCYQSVVRGWFYPVSMDCLPTSANQEAHVSMATFASRRLKDMSDNTAGILALELLASCQGVDFCAPLKASEMHEIAKTELRSVVPFYYKDRYFSPDIEKAKSVIASGQFKRFMTEDLLPGVSV
ncbi:MAG: aromatic amino acid lyase [Amphritea sp.]